MLRRCILPCLLIAVVSVGQAAPEPGTHAHYLVLTSSVGNAPPFPVVDFIYGTSEQIDGKDYIWWQMEIRAEDKWEVEPVFTVRALTSRDPLAASDKPLEFGRYLLSIGETDETYEYRDIHTGEALLPAWRDFTQQFIPRPVFATRYQNGVPETCEYLGHVLTLNRVGHGVKREQWTDAKVLDLDRELLVGTGRNFKDTLGHRLPQKPEKQNYPWVEFSESDYRTMIRAGINLFQVRPQQEKFVRGEPVFYQRGVPGAPALRYPADLYRSNYYGLVMFMDEPTIIMIGDKNIHNTLRYFSDAATLIERRVRARYNSTASYGALQLDHSLRQAGHNLGDMRIEQYDYPSWETIFETAYYQMRGPLAGIVHEGRYQLDEFDRNIAKWTGRKRTHTAEELLRYHFAFLRGGTRPFGKHWGTSIYGQADTAISPTAVKLAYDMGARYVWFWTSDHDHHMPWPEQLELARILRDHAARNPRPSIFGPQPTLDKVVTIPYPYFVSLRNMWWLRVLDPEGKNEASQKYARLMRRTIAAVHEAMEAGEDFDITVDDGREIKGYRQVVRITDD